MLLGMSIHHLDQFRFLFGDPEEITAFTATYPGQPWAGDSIALYVLRYADGLMATAFDDGFPWTRDWSEDYRIEGLEAIARGTIGWPSGEFSTLEVHDARPTRLLAAAGFHAQVVPGRLRGHDGRAVPGHRDRHSSRPSRVPTTSATLRLVEAGYLSAAERRTVRLTEIPG